MGRVEVVRGFDGDGYPEPRHEVARLTPKRQRNLRARAAALTAVRRYFEREGFLEVETPLLVPSPGLEIHLEAIAAADGWLITSPEYQMKRLLTGGLEKIFQVCRCFRGDEAGAHHQREFTMIEWYRAWDGLDSIATDVEHLVAEVCAAGAALVEPNRGEGTSVATAGRSFARIGERVIDVTPPWPRLTVADACARLAGVSVVGDESAEELIRRARHVGLDVGDATAWDDVFFAIFLARVEPALAALDHPVLLTDWPLPLAALARQRPDGAPVVERFEAYVAGIELANAFGELTDPVAQRARFEGDQAVRLDRGKPVYPLDEKLLAALEEGMPPSAGVALGFDRLVMLATGSRHIRQVVAFADDER